LRIVVLIAVAALFGSCARTDPVVDGGGDGDAGPDGDGDGDIHDDDAPDACDEAPCGLWPQCGCAARQTCVHLEEGGTTCVDAGTYPHGQVCAGDGRLCGIGTVCTGYADEPSYCLQYCTEDEDCAHLGEGSLCELRFVDELDRVLARACSIACAPSSSTPSCAENVHCVISVRESTGELFTHCVGAAGQGEDGATCDPARGALDCTAGYFCADAGRGYECIRRCTMPTGPECVSGTICRSFPDPAIIGTTEYGYCL
jgi:hypothetical protein